MNTVNSTNYVLRAESYESVTLFKKTNTSNYPTSLAIQSFFAPRYNSLYIHPQTHTLSLSTQDSKWDRVVAPSYQLFRVDNIAPQLHTILYLSI